MQPVGTGTSHQHELRGCSVDYFSVIKSQRNSLIFSCTGTKTDGGSLLESCRTKILNIMSSFDCVI